MSLNETFFNDASDEQTGRRFVKFNKQKEKTAGQTCERRQIKMSIGSALTRKQKEKAELAKAQADYARIAAKNAAKNKGKSAATSANVKPKTTVGSRVASAAYQKQQEAQAKIDYARIAAKNAAKAKARKKSGK